MNDKFIHKKPVMVHDLSRTLPAIALVKIQGRQMPDQHTHVTGVYVDANNNLHIEVWLPDLDSTVPVDGSRAIQVYGAGQWLSYEIFKGASE